MRSRVLIIIAALVLGSVAALLVFSYLNAAQMRIRADAQPVKVLVAKKDIPRGTTIEDAVAQKLAELDSVPKRYVADGAISSQRAVAGQVVASELTRGEQLTASHFQLPAQAGLAYNVPPDYVAVSIPTDQFRGIAGFVKPGDSVAVVGTIGNDDKAITRILAPRARVLAVRQDVGTGDAGQAQAKNGSNVFNGQGNQQGQTAQTQYTITLAVSRADVERLVLVQEKGKLWLALAGGTTTAANTAPSTGGQNFSTVLSTERNAGLR